MLNSTLFRRLFTGYTVIILIITMITSELIGRQISKSSKEDINHSLAVRAQLIAELSKPLLLDTSPEKTVNLQTAVARLGKETESRITIIDTKGLVLGDSEQAPELMDNHLLRPEIIAAGSKHNASATRFSQTIQQEMVYFATQVVVNQQPLGYVRVSLSLKTIDEKIVQLRKVVLFSAIIAAITALILGFSFIINFSSPLKNINQVAQSIAQGDYSKRITTTYNNEIGELINSFNLIAHKSEERINEIIAERNRLTMVFSGMVEGVIYVNEDFEIIHINRAASKMLSLREMSINQVDIAKINDDEIVAALHEAIEKQGVVKTKLERDQNTVIDMYIAALTNDIGEPIGAVIVLNDISELVYLERVRRDFVANASHELKTPITAIQGLTETIVDDVDMPAAIRSRFIEKIKVQAIRLSALVTDLISVSRLDSAQNMVHSDLIDLTAIVKTSVKNARNLCQQKQLNLSSELPSKKLKIAGDNQEISQLIDNLLNNAINYTPSAGYIDVTLANVKEKDKELAVIKVRDTGIGIGKAYQARIFERFYREDQARSRDLGGTGLGLSICKNIADKHNGSISVSSRKNHGSVFTVKLPLSKV